MGYLETGTVIMTIRVITSTKCLMNGLNSVLYKFHTPGNMNIVLLKVVDVLKQGLHIPFVVIFVYENGRNRQDVNIWIREVPVPQNNWNW